MLPPNTIHAFLDSPPWAELTKTQLALGAGAAILLYNVLLGVYRIWFHPLAHIPGPFLARLTWL